MFLSSTDVEATVNLNVSSVQVICMQPRVKMTKVSALYSVFLNDGRPVDDLLCGFAAESTYRQALLADPNHVATLNNLGHLVHTHRNNIEEAEALYRCGRCIEFMSHFSNLIRAHYH
jgi:hypothetical protein